MATGVIEFEILTPEREIQLRREAKAVLASTRRKPTCACAASWVIDGPYCGYCGKWRPRVSFASANSALRDAQRLEISR